MVKEKILKYLVEGHFLRTVRERLDALIARIARWIMRESMKTQGNKVLFMTQDDRYCCNPKYICNEIRKRNQSGKIDTVFVVSKGHRGKVPEDVRIVSRGTLDYYKEMFSAKVIVSNSTLYSKQAFGLRKDQVLIQTWHGSLGIKRFDEKSYKSGWHWVRAMKRCAKMTKYIVSNSAFEDMVYRESYWPKTTIVRYGHARNDIMFDRYSDLRNEIRNEFVNQYELPQDAHFILYGPTYRDSNNFDCYNIDVGAILNSAKERFGGEWFLLLRYHVKLREIYKSRKNEYDNDHVIDVTNFDDIQELITIADIAITDYSSWIYDFVLQRKPGFIFATDIDSYNDERGLYYPLEATPFSIATDRNQLSENIRMFDRAEYDKKLDSFLQDKECVDDGHASERVADLIFEELKINQA